MLCAPRMILWIIKTESDVSSTSKIRKTRSGGYPGHGWEELRERNFGFDSLKSRLNCDMEEKGIALQELSGRTTAELLPPELPGCRRVGQWEVIFKCAPFLHRRGHWNWLARSVTVLSEISHSKNHVRTYFKVCMSVEAPETQNNIPNPRKKCS
jgi:hypothetical protein